MRGYNYSARSRKTQYGDFEFDSALEACWAAMFDQLGWRWTPQPVMLDGWIPDFRLDMHVSVFVEVKPRITAAVGRIMDSYFTGGDVPDSVPAGLLLDEHAGCINAVDFMQGFGAGTCGGGEEMLLGPGCGGYCRFSLRPVSGSWTCWVCGTHDKLQDPPWDAIKRMWREAQARTCLTLPKRKPHVVFPRPVELPTITTCLPVRRVLTEHEMGYWDRRRKQEIEEEISELESMWGGSVDRSVNSYKAKRLRDLMLELNPELELEDCDLDWKSIKPTESFAWQRMKGTETLLRLRASSRAQQLAKAAKK